MDIITQGIAGAALAQTGIAKEKFFHATLVGFLAGMLADADILIRSADDPLLNIEYHRQFSHSLFFIPVGALIVALLLWPFMKRHLSLPRLYLFSLLGFSGAGLLDACTSFGTQLLWPFSSDRIAWNLISIIDPVFTLGLVISVSIAWKLNNKLYSFIGLAFALCYLGLGFFQNQQVMELQQELAEARGHRMEKSVVKPTLGNIILWRSVYEYNDQYYVDGIRLGLFSSPRIYQGDSIETYRAPPVLPGVTRTLQQAQDEQRFNVLSQGYLVRHPDEPHVIGDIRYAMLPDSIQPLWGIRMDPEKPRDHVSLETFRRNDESTRNRYLDMLFGR